MRIMVKGGVWKDGEDAILKAAVMKYGKDQWARVSSLLVPKSAKQCKSRWYECLDPSIRKTKWTREDDEKLLHFAKLKPTQWRRIASILGRASSQCLERYEKLPNPEPNPACPDLLAIDEDEKEMLLEARVRLANTKGKKAKRIAREKQLDEARRLVSLLRKRKPIRIDSTAEIPFENSAPVRFYAAADEDGVNLPTTTEGLEGKGRADIEAQLRKQDVAQRQDALAAILQANMLNDLEATRKRQKLMLRPQRILDSELEGVAKMGYASDLLADNEEEELTEGSAATRALLADKSQTPTQGTFGGKGVAIVMEADNLPGLRDSQTPLLGGDNPELHSFDFSAVTPRNKEIQTLDPMLSSSITPAGAALPPRICLTPSRDGSSFALTPFRDELHINEHMDIRERDKLEEDEKIEPEADDHNKAEEENEEEKTEEAEEDSVEEAEGDNAKETLVTLKLLCHFKKKMHRNFKETVARISENSHVSIKVDRRHFEDDYAYLIISVSALEVFDEKNSPTLETALQLFGCCCEVVGRPELHLQRLAIGKSRICLIADSVTSFNTGYFSLSKGYTKKKLVTGSGLLVCVTNDAKRTYEKFVVELSGPLKVVERAFKEAIVELRTNSFPR